LFLLLLYMLQGHFILNLPVCFLDLPVNGPGKGGRVNMNQQQAVIKSFGKDTTRGNIYMLEICTFVNKYICIYR
jgi:hypothetical protein